MGETVFERGFFNLGRISGVPVRLHWTAPLGAWFFSGLSFDPAAILCFLGVVLVHELGHALMVKLSGARVVGIELTGYGGVCRWQGDPPVLARGRIAWGGVWAQLALAAVVAVFWELGGPGQSLRPLLVDRNLGMALFNLLPVPPLDGFEAWQLPFKWGRQVRARLTGRPADFEPLTAPPVEDFGDHQAQAKQIADALLAQARRDPEE